MPYFKTCSEESTCIRYSTLALMVCGTEAVPIRIDVEPGEFVRQACKRWNCQNVLIKGSDGSRADTGNMDVCELVQ